MPAERAGSTNFISVHASITTKTLRRRSKSGRRTLAAASIATSVVVSVKSWNLLLRHHQARATFQISSICVPELRTTLAIGQKRWRSALTFSRSASLASVVTLMTRRIFGNGTSISSSSCVPRRASVDSPAIDIALMSTPCCFAHLCLITLVHAIRAATIVSVGVRPMLVPSRSLGSSMTVLTSRVATSVRVWVGHSARMRWVTVVFSLMTTMGLPSPLCRWPKVSGLVDRLAACVVQPIGHRAVCADRVRHGIGQDRLEPVEGRGAQQRIALVDQVEHRSNDKRDIERAARDAVGDRVVAGELPRRFRSRLL